MRGLLRHGGWFIAAAALLLNLVHAARDRHLSSPPEIGDGVDYDSMGLNLARGRGFGYFRADPEWRAPYEAAIADGGDHYAALMLRGTPFQPTTYRPPLFPVLLAAIYSTIGRHFVVWRVLSCAMGAAAGLVMFGVTRRLAGTAAAWIAGALFLIDPYQRHFSGLYLTEGLATLLAVVLAAAALEVSQRPRPSWFAALGVALSLAVLTRSIFIFLLPPVALLVVWRGWTQRAGGGWRGVGLFALACAALMGPWWVRNCLALDGFMPLGVQAGINLPAGYNDAALENGGNWDHDVRNRLYQEAGYVPPPGATKLEAERHRAEYGLELTMKWIGENPEKLPMLFAVKVATMWGSSKFSLLTLAIAGLGLALARPLRLRAPLILMLLFYTVAVGLTWEAGGRFRIPLMPLVYVLAADAMVAAAMRAREGRPVGPGGDRTDSVGGSG